MYDDVLVMLKFFSREIKYTDMTSNLICMCHSKKCTVAGIFVVNVHCGNKNLKNKRVQILRIGKF